MKREMNGSFSVELYIHDNIFFASKKNVHFAVVLFSLIETIFFCIHRTLSSYYVKVNFISIILDILLLFVLLLSLL